MDNGERYMDPRGIFVATIANNYHGILRSRRSLRGGRCRESYPWILWLGYDHGWLSRVCTAGIALHGRIGRSEGPRPLSSTLHASKTNEVVQFDSLYIGTGTKEMKCVLEIKDNLSSYRLLRPTATTDSELATKEISRWIRVFSAIHGWVSDQGSHFKNNLIFGLTKTNRIKHSFTVAYSTWVNGTVQNTMSHVRATCTSLHSEFKLGPHEWPLVIVQLFER